MADTSNGELSLKAFQFEPVPWPGSASPCFFQAHDIIRKGKDILPGHFTTLQCSLEFRDRLPKPYGKCKEETQKLRLNRKLRRGSLAAVRLAAPILG